MGKLSHFDTLYANVADICKLLKNKTFNIEKFLDTPVFRAIRFRQKVLADFAFR